MTILQRIILILGIALSSHTLLVPPVVEDCRYHVFTERAMPYSKHFNHEGVDNRAMLTELAMLWGVFSMAFLATGKWRKKTVPWQNKS